MLANQLAETIADRAAAIALAICGVCRNLGGVPIAPRTCRKRSDFLCRAHGYGVCLTQCTVHRSSLSHPKFGAMDQGIDIRRIGIAEAGKAFAGGGPVNGGFARPTRIAWITEFGRHIDVNAATFLAPGQAKQTRMRDVPFAFDQQQVPTFNRYSELC